MGQARSCRRRCRPRVKHCMPRGPPRNGSLQFNRQGKPLVQRALLLSRRVLLSTPKPRVSTGEGASKGRICANSQRRRRGGLKRCPLSFRVYASQSTCFLGGILYSQDLKLHLTQTM